MKREQRRRIAVTMIVVGALLIVVGVAGAVRDGDDPVETTAVSTTVASAAAATTSTTTTSEPSTTVATTRTTSTSTSSTLPPETVEDFALEFAAALERGDATFVFDRLHPIVIAIYDEASCRTTVEDRVLLINGYRLAGPVSGPEAVDFTVSNRIITATELFRAPVAFDFQGAEVEAEGVFARVDGEMRWFTDCE